MSRPIRVLNIVSRLARGGAELRLLELAESLDRRQYQLDFCTLSDKPGELEARADEAGSKVYPAGLRQWGFSTRFRQILRQERFDVVHSHVRLASGYLLRLAAQCDIAVRVAHFHSMSDGRGQGPLRKAYRRLMRSWLNRYATHILAASAGAMEHTWGPDWQANPRCQVVFNGVDLSQFADNSTPNTVRREFGITEEAPLYLHVGRITEAKNHLRLIDIFAAVQQYQPDAILLLAGKGPTVLEQRLRQHISACSLETAVVLTGERTDVPRLLAAADAMIFPSLWEGLPGAVVEACAAGTPVIASDLPGIREIASLLSGVYCLPLNASNEDWATTVLQAANKKQPKNDALHRFAQSAFTLERCALSICKVWDTAKRTMREAA